jgi:hypothetical protein
MTGTAHPQASMAARAPNQDMPVLHENRHDHGSYKAFDAAPTERSGATRGYGHT